MRSFQNFAALVATLLVPIAYASTAKAGNSGLYVEPLVGYIQASNEYTFKPPYGSSTDKTAVTGITYGGVLGWVFDSGFRIGADVEMSNQDLKVESTGTTSKWSTTSMALVLGYKFPKDIVAYVAIGQGSSVDDQTPKTTVTGTVLKAGGQKELVSHVAVSVEYIMYAWNDSTQEGSSAIKFSDLYDKFSSNGIQASVRFPFDIGGK